MLLALFMLEAADCTTPERYPIINSIDCNWRSTQLDGKFTYICKFLNTDRLTLFTGMRFAFMQAKTGLCHILSHFEVAPCKETPMRIVMDKKSVLVMTDQEVPLSFKRIQY